MVGESSSLKPKCSTQYIYSEGGWEPLARVDSTGRYSEVFWYHTELNGLPERMTDYRGDVIWRGRFSLWGETEYENSGVSLNVPQNLRFQGQYLDRESGLHYNLFRYYDPAGGRFTQSDPIGLAGGLNTYAYVGDPLSWIDPLGLAGCSVNFSPKQLQKKFKHASDFGVTGNANKQGLEAFENAMRNHIDLPGTTKITGKYRWDQDVHHYFDPQTKLNVMTDMDGNFISGWKLSERQVTDLLGVGNVF